MLQIAAGRFFRPGVALYERTHRATFYSNACFLDSTPVQLPVGTIIGATPLREVSTIMLEAIDRLEATRPDGSHEFLLATSGQELLDDISYVMTFVLNRTFSRNHDEVHRLVSGGGRIGPRSNAAGLVPGLFEPRVMIQPGDLDELKTFMTVVLGLSREDFVRVMRVIRGSVDATRRAVDDPTGAYTDLVAALESLADDHLTTPVTWERYDGRARKIIDAALAGEQPALIAKVHAAVLQAERVGLKRRFVSSTMARISPAYYRSEAIGVMRAPQSADLERMLGLAYDIRSRRGHILEDLGEEAWVSTDGAETAFEPRFRRILTIAGLWRLVRHVVRGFVAQAPQVAAEPWDYRSALPGILRMQLASQFWVSQSEGFDADTAEMWFNGVAEAFISWYSGQSKEGIDPTGVVAKIERRVPVLADGTAKTTMVALHALWHAWTDPELTRPDAKAFLDAYGHCLDDPSPVVFSVAVLSDRAFPDWTTQQWTELAQQRRADRLTGKEAPLPTAVDVLLQLEVADRLEAAGLHEQAIEFAANAVEECPGHADLLAWEQRLVAGDHDPHFNCHKFIYGTDCVTGSGAEEPTTARDDVRDDASPVSEDTTAT